MKTMIGRTTALFVLLFLMNGAAHAEDYFPLATGNTWFTRSIPLIVGEKETVEGVEYYAMYNAEEYIYHFRKDDNSKVYRKNKDVPEELYYDIEAEAGDTWIYRDNRMGHFEVTLESRTATVVTDFGTFDNCLEYSFIAIPVEYDGGISYTYDADYAIWLAPGIGLIKSASISWGTESTLIKARIDGVTIPEDPPLPEVKRTIPVDGQENIPVDTYIRIFETFGLRPETVNSGTITVTSASEGAIPGTFDDRSYRSGTITFNPRRALPYDDTIKVVVTKGVRGYIDESLAEEYRFTFRTEEKTEAQTLFLEDTESIVTSLGNGDFDWGDFDGDGDNDLVIIGQNNNIGGGDLFENRGGTFERMDVEFCGLKLHAGDGTGCVHWVDYNGDDRLDIVYAGKDSLFQSRTLFYRNTGTGFEEEAEMEMPYGYASTDWFDYNGDGFPDLAIWGPVEEGGTNASVFKNDGGELKKLDIPGLPTESTGIIQWIDFNGDGAMDIITIGPHYMYESGFFANYGGVFQKEDLTITDEIWIGSLYHCDTADPDGDGDIDLVIGPYLLIREDDAFSVTAIDKYYSGAVTRFDDYDGDGDIDLLVSGSKDDAVYRDRGYIQLFENTGGELTMVQDLNLERDIYYYAGMWYDIDKDGALDFSVLTNVGFFIYYSTLEKITSVEDTGETIPEPFAVRAFPNPFNSNTAISCMIPTAGHLSVRVYAVNGQLAKILYSGACERGSHIVRWDGTDVNGRTVSSGAYIISLGMGKQTAQTKITFMK